MRIVYRRMVIGVPPVVARGPLDCGEAGHIVLYEKVGSVELERSADSAVLDGLRARLL